MGKLSGPRTHSSTVVTPSAFGIVVDMFRCRYDPSLYVLRVDKRWTKGMVCEILMVDIRGLVTAMSGYC
jgi:hypothetical protein